MHLHWTLLAIMTLAIGLSGCTRYYFFGSGEAACLELISEREPILKGEAQALKRWQATEYCRRVRERWAAITMASLPDLGLPAPGQTFVLENNVTFDVGVRNEGRADSGPFDLLVQAWAGVTSSAPPTFSTRLPIGNLTPMGTPGESAHQQVTVPVPTARPVDVILRLTADPPTPASPGGAVRESDENNNVRERTFTIY